MAEPTHYPTWRYWEGGRSVMVSTPAEYAALPPGHSDTPAGPFPSAPEEEPPYRGTGPAPDRGPGPAEEEEPERDAASLREQARALARQGQSVRQIAETLQRSPRTVGRWLGD